MTIMSNTSGFPQAEAVIGREVEVSKADLKEFVRTGIVKKIDNHQEHYAIQPCWINDTASGILEEINSNTLGRWNKKLKAYVVAVHNIINSDTSAGLNEDHNWLHVDISATYYTYCPEEEQILTGVVQKIGNRAAVCSVFDVFTATVFAEDNEELASWQVGDRLEFKIYSYVHRRKGPIIRGKKLNVFSSRCELDEVPKKMDRDFDTAEPEMSSVTANGDGETNDESFASSSKSKKKKKRKKHDNEEGDTISNSFEDHNVNDDPDVANMADDTPVKKKKKKKKNSQE